MSIDQPVVVQTRAAGRSPFTRLASRRLTRGLPMWRAGMLALCLAALWMAGSGSGTPVVAEAAPLVPTTSAVAVSPPAPTLAPAVVSVPPPAPPSTRPQVVAALPAGWRMIDGRLHRPARKLKMRVTSYCHRACCCGTHADQRTASGRPVWTNGGNLVAADTRLLPFGTHVSIPGYHGGDPVPVLDRGGRIKGHRLDVLRPSHRQANAWGVRYLDVIVWEPVAQGEHPD
ncbi:MAG: 3D domain-containing protein, partial [Phycisphaerae bacterium]|nr:3D domain-containing protein [Phycisphaerae bacterium]